MPQSTVAIHTTRVLARAGCSGQVEACLSPLIEPTLQMQGCLHFALQQSRNEPLLWHVVGYWQDQASMLAYFETPLMQVYSVLMHSHVVDRLDFQSDCEAAVSGLQKRAG
ncbi:antibiotic biosynthesis monooxygenase [Pseudomonas lundensis]|uniref:putative quinol monooxygenase n=1 Tax=Pseudomonas lundensis TaxID=86185 RepID=UPI000BA29F3C|nr:antibiotic biosynthesis monooxygenase [Pseudomonas lundensis]OZY37802.1 antibiotic biosynthesis monooxygenase [Pseudomonas lundensis]